MIYCVSFALSQCAPHHWVVIYLLQTEAFLKSLIRGARLANRGLLRAGDIADDSNVVAGRPTED